MIKINDLRLSWIWMEAFPDLLADPPKLQSRWGDLQSEVEYEGLFTAARQNQNALTLPWPAGEDDHKHLFWSRYLGEEPRETTAARAFRALVPLREAKLGKITGPLSGSRIWATAYHYPHALGIVLNAELKMDLDLDSMVEEALELARNTKLEIQWRNAAPEQMKLLDLGETVLSNLRSETFGAQAGAGMRSAKPFTVATFVRGDVGGGVAPKVKDASAVHRALEALCSWNPYWTTATLHPLADRRLPTKSAPASHVLYGLTSGRAVWFPEGFPVPEPSAARVSAKKKVSLGCYHHNLTFASLQTESLARLIVLAQGTYMRGETPSPSMQRLVRRAAGILGQTYGGDTAVYSSFSPAVQLDDNGWTANLAYVRNQLNMPGTLHKNRNGKA
jgi:hypothetical protein